MSRINIAVKFGNNELIFYRQGVGVIARHQSFLAVSQRGGRIKVKAFGNDAQKIADSKNVFVYKPFDRLDVKNHRMATILVRKILDDCIMDKFFLTSINVLIAVPCAMNHKQLSDLKSVFKNAGCRKVTFVQNGVCSRAYFDQFSPNDYAVMVDIGKFVTDISVLNDFEFLKGKVCLLGGVDMDSALQTYIKDNFDLSINIQTAENLKKNIGSLYNKDLFSTEFLGVNEDNSVINQQITANEIRVAISNTYDHIFDLVSEFIDSLSNEIKIQLTKTGIVLSGGASCIPGLFEYANKKFAYPIHIVNNPKESSILGAGKLLSKDKQFIKISF